MHVLQPLYHILLHVLNSMCVCVCVCGGGNGIMLSGSLFVDLAGTSASVIKVD